MPIFNNSNKSKSLELLGVTLIPIVKIRACSNIIILKFRILNTQSISSGKIFQSTLCSSHRAQTRVKSPNLFRIRIGRNDPRGTLINKSFHAHLITTRANAKNSLLFRRDRSGGCNIKPSRTYIALIGPAISNRANFPAK